MSGSVAVKGASARLTRGMGYDARNTVSNL